MNTILVVDDDKNLALLYQEELSEEGYRVILKHDAREAIEHVEKEPPDLVVLDIRMPGLDGIEAMSRILSKNSHLPVILNTAYSSYSENFTCWSADAYVVKSSDLTELKREIRQALQKRGKAQE